jgi:hypothetical protein
MGWLEGKVALAPQPEGWFMGMERIAMAGRELYLTAAWS